MLIPVSGSSMASTTFALVHENVRNGKTSEVRSFEVGDNHVQNVGRVELRKPITSARVHTRGFGAKLAMLSVLIDDR
jgi:hypothetical protein